MTASPMYFSTMPAMTLDDGAHLAEVARQQIPVRLRIELPAQP